MIRKTHSTRNRRGLTLTELTIVLGIMGIVMASVWSVVSSVWSNFYYRRMNEEIMTVVTNIRSRFGPVGCIKFVANSCPTNPLATGTNITANLDANLYRLIPVTMRLDPAVPGAMIRHSGGGQFTVSAITNGGVNGRAFRLTMDGLSRSTCIKLLMEFPVTMAEMGVIRLAAPGGTYDPIEPRNPAGLHADFPIQLGRAQLLCTTPNNNTVSYDFRLFP